MEINTEIQKSDYRLFNKLAVKNVLEYRSLGSKLFYLNVFSWALFAAGAMGLIEYYQECANCDFTHLNRAVFFVFVFIISSIAIQRWSYSAFIDSAVYDEGVTLGKITFLIDEDGITQTNSNMKEFYKWDVIKSVIYDSDILFLFVDRSKAIILPTRNNNDNDTAVLNNILKQHVNYEFTK